MDIILASGSPRRKQLLAQMGLTQFKVVPSDADETVDPTLSPAQLVEQLSLRKAQAVASHSKADDLIIAADTIVTLDGWVMGKPADQVEAFTILTALSGGRHQVYTGVTLLRDEQIITDHVCTNVTLRTLTEGEINAYIATGEPMDKAGAYGIQGLGALLVEKIEGDYFNVMGLPICRLSQLLLSYGIDCLANPDPKRSGR